MLHPFKAVSLIALTLSFHAAGCSDMSSPSHERIHPTAGGPLRNVVVNGPDDVPLEDGMEMPDEFRNAPLIASTALDVGFRPGIVWATASMDHYSTHGKVVLRLRLKKGETLIDQDSAVAINEELLPWSMRLPARVNLSTPADCGYRADAAANFSAWMGFPIPNTGTLFTWGLVSKPESKPGSQPACPSGGGGGGGGGGAGGGGSGEWESEESDWLSDLLGEDPWESDGPQAPEYSEEYEGECHVCQLWYAVLDGEVIATWWECTEVDESYCSSFADVF